MGGISGVDGTGGGRFSRGNFDFNLHPRIYKTGRDHRSRGPDVPKIPAQNWPAGLEIFNFRQDVAYPHDIRQPATSFRECGFDISHALLGLLDYVAGDGHRPIVESGRAGHEYQVTVNDGPGISNFAFEGRSG
jgi:hypothetical protein